MNRILTSFSICFFFALLLQAQTPSQVMFSRTGPSSGARMCTNDAGTIAGFGPFIGQSNDITPDTIYLCLGDTLFIDHAGDQDLSGDPNPNTTPGVGYAFFNCPPTATGPDTASIKNDFCIFDDGNAVYGFYVYTGGVRSGDVPFFNDGNLINTFNAGMPAIYYFAPITFDSLALGEFATYEGNPVGDCINLRADQAFAVAYLNAITVSAVNVTGCQGTFRVTGGLSELDNSNYTQISIYNQADPTVLGTVSSGPANHNDVVNFSVPAPGTYVIEVTDGKSCSGSATATITSSCDEVTIFLPLTNVLPGSNECIPVTVENFVNITSVQFSINWDPTILTITSVQGFNPMLPDLGTGNFSWRNFPSPNGIAPGVMGFTWTDFTFAGIDLPDGDTFFEICFDVIGQLGDCSNLDITNNPVPIEIGDPDQNIFQLVTRPGKVRVSDDPFFVLLQQDSLTCPSFDDGSFTVTVDEGLAPYRFVWNTVPLSGPNSAPVVIGANGGSGIVSGLAAGRYQVTITDNTVPAQVVIDTIEVLSGPVLGITIRDTIPSCFGVRDGSLRFIPTSDGTPLNNPGPGYTFVWSTPLSVPNPGNVNFIDNIPAGSYGITVTDPAGCQENALIPLGTPPALRVLDSNTFITDASCTGGQDGQITITASGGTTASGNYTFTWNTGLVIQASTTTLSNINPGQYCVTVTDDNLCSTEKCFVVNAIKTLAINGVVTDVDCNGQTTGEVFITGTTSGAAAATPYAFVWSANAPAANNTGTTSQILNLAAGSYIVTMTDASAAGCRVIDTFAVAQPTPLVATVLNFTNETCTVGNDGSVTLGVSGGVGPYTYSWDHDALLTDSLATNLSAGMYTIVVTDANNCSQQVMQSVSAPTPPAVTSLPDDSVTCADDTDGSLLVMATSPAGPVTNFQWSTGQSGAAINGLPPGEYIVTITAPNACVTIDTAYVTAPEPIRLDSVRVRQPNCPGESTGQIAIFSAGGTGPYMYLWSTMPGTPTTQNPLPARPAGDYTVVVIDANQCTSEVFNITIVDPPSIVVTFSNIQDTSCPDDATCDGQATATASYSDGSPGSFIFTWDTGEMTTSATTATSIQLCEGVQNLNVIDANNCGVNVSFTIAAPDPITVLPTITPVSCNGLADGSVGVVPMGGTGPYNYFWVETNETTSAISGLSAGNYTAIITDDNSCTFTQTVVVGQPAPIVISVNPATTTDFVTCAGDTDGIIAVNTTGGNVTPANPYQYTWSDGAMGNLNANLAASTYSVTVTDFKNCMDELSFTILEPELIQFFLDPIDPPLCFGDPTFVSIDTVFGGANNAFEEYTFMVDNNGLSFPVLQPATVFAGNHIITVEDINGCAAETAISIASPGQITITIASPIVIELGDSTVQLQPMVSPGGNYSYQWTPGDFLSSDTIRNPFIFPENSLDYTLTVVNENGCTATQNVFVELDANRNVYIPDIFSPNNDGRNDNFEVFTCRGVRQVRSARLFDRWGGLLYEGTKLDPNCLNGIKLWDGTKNGQTLPPGVYVYLIEVEFLDDVILTYRGDVTLVR